MKLLAPKNDNERLKIMKNLWCGFRLFIGCMNYRSSNKRFKMTLRYVDGRKMDVYMFVDLTGLI